MGANVAVAIAVRAGGERPGVGSIVPIGPCIPREKILASGIAADHCPVVVDVADVPKLGKTLRVESADMKPR